MAGRLPRGRSTKKRSRGKRYLIVTNGKVTEKEYFERLVDLYGLRGCVVIDKGAAGRDPKTLVERAADLKAKEDEEARKERFDSWESVWAVTDVDDFSMFAAQQLAKQEAVSLAVSNPCFEGVAHGPCDCLSGVLRRNKSMRKEGAGAGSDLFKGEEEQVT